jgi:hypothetical protein
MDRFGPATFIFELDNRSADTDGSCGANPYPALTEKT